MCRNECDDQQKQYDRNYMTMDDIYVTVCKDTTETM